ncbi:hypothetical protein [Vibrio cyclitrophicus]|uniref:hypothetical protein n=1 Tax=Vibrio cyclitrophicus TaxID=47951 RepID=UPI000371F508|nr:hypothetical protein [Vibrio cyclitrophicus]KAA8600031.1 hypothetical protein F0Z19_1953 [Vibrio cyclitrophicus]NOH43198.1 hypothetical protein [Vibrio cyclitrophicus]OCH38441.1 hypothetical protein A6E07_01945 [Vibrio cyclitrophicus]OED76252.1 hypothetical protein OAS_00745 [Vibrio cyclitrophicus ZF65]OEE05946.1 hypothetical protein OAO_01010 [Vibrio cyclitrophicus ZF28]
MSQMDILPSLKKQLMYNCVIAFFGAYAVTLIGSDDIYKQASRAGVALCYTATILAIYRVLFTDKLRDEARRIIASIRNIENESDHLKHNIYTQEEADKVEQDKGAKQSEQLTRLADVSDIGSREKAHILLSIALAGIGSVLQLFGAT